MSGVGRIFLLGDIRWKRPGAEQLLAGTQPRIVLAYTALERDRPVSTEQLAEALWPEHLPKHWEGALRGVVRKVRSFLSTTGPAAPVLDNVGRSYRFSCSDVHLIDVWQGEAELLTAEREVAAGRPHAANASSRLAATMLAGPLLPGVEGTWLLTRRAELAGLRRRALRAASIVASADGRHDEAIELASRALDVDRYDEESHRTLMAAYLGAGAPREALRCYGECRRILAEALGVSPSAATEGLHVQLLIHENHREMPRRADRDHEPPKVTLVDHPFVGRSAESAVLSGAWDDACRGHRQMVLLHGEAGVGKTRTALEAIRTARPVNVLYGRSSLPRLAPFEPFVEALERHLVQLADDELVALVGSAGPALATVLPVFASRCGIEPVEVRDGDNRPRVFEAVRLLIAGIATEPTILVLDDLHWADASSLLLLAHLLRMLDGARLLVLGTYRDDHEPSAQFSDAIVELHRLGGCRSVHLEGLQAPDVVEMLRAGDVIDADELGRLLHERTGGNGFYLSQVLAATTEATGSWDLLRVPDTVDELVRRRVTTLSDPARGVLAMAAVLGATMSVEHLDRAVALGGGELAALDELVGRNLLLEGGDGEVSFVHAIVRDAVYGQLARTRRRQLHLRAARSLELLGRSDDERWAVLAHHYLVADDPAHGAEVVDATVRAAEHAMRLFAYERAAGLFEQAIGFLDRFSLDDEREAAIHVGLGAARRRVGDFGAARQALGRAIELARVAGHEAVFADAVLELVAKGGRGVAVDMPDAERADLLGEAVDRVGDDGDPGLVVSLLAELALALLLTDQTERRRAAAQRAYETARASGRAALVARATVAHRLLWSRPNWAAARLAHTDALVASARHDVTAEQLVRLHMWRLTDSYELGDRTGVDREQAALDDVAQQLGQPYWRWLAASWHALSTFVSGDPDQADAEAVAALEHVAGLDHPEVLVSYGIQLVGFRLQQGRGSEVIGILRDAVRDHPGVVAMRCALLFALAQAGYDDEACRGLRMLLADGLGRLPEDSSWSTAVTCLAETACALGEEQAAVQLIPVLEPYREQFVVVSGFGAGAGCWGPISGVLGALRACTGDLSRARREFDDALEALTQFDAPLLVERVAIARERVLTPSLST